MRFGCCVRAEDIPVIAQAGFDYCELPAASVLPFEDDQAALPALRAIDGAQLPAEAFNILVPPQLPLVGPSVDHDALRTYLRRTFGRMVQMGGVVVVLGSGGARRIPDGMPRDVALDQLAESLRLAADEATQAGIELALEHLNRGECNVFNRIDECQAFIEERGLSGLRLLADLHHLELEHESTDSVLAAAPLLAHAHVADGGRRAPGNGGYDYAGFMQALNATGYDRRISAECSWQDLAAEAPGALAYMRTAWEERA